MASSTAVLETLSESKQPVQSKKGTVALLDVDDTLISDYVIDINDTTTVEDYKTALLKKGVLNTNLIKALQHADITDAYFFTDMTISRNRVMERHALIEILDTYKIKIHGVITPADCVYHLNKETLKKAFESEKIFQEFQKLLKSTSTPQDFISQFNDYSFDTYRANQGEPGKVYKDAYDNINDTKAMNEMRERCNHAKAFIDIISILENKAHVKANMYELFMKHYKDNYSKCLIFDDRQDVINSINALKPPVLTLTLMVNNLRKKQKNENVVTYNEYNFLNDLCNDYINHLNQYTNDPKANRKLVAVNTMKLALSLEKPDHGLSDFRKLFDENKAMLEQHRDSACIRFLKGVAFILSLGIAHFVFGIWNVRGEAFTNQVTPFLPPAETKKMTA